MSEQPIGFLVWCPEASFPRCVHETYEQACTEAARLTRAHQGQRFIVMSPVQSLGAVMDAQAWSDGRRVGYIQGKRDARADQTADTERRFRKVERNASAFQTIVADCLLWFDGFHAAHLGRESYDRPRIPDREQLRDLNGTLQELAAVAPRGRDISDDDIPF